MISSPIYRLNNKGDWALLYRIGNESRRNESQSEEVGGYVSDCFAQDTRLLLCLQYILRPN